MNYRRDSFDFYFDLPFEGARPFWLAARFGQPNIMRLLVEYGADPLWTFYVENWGRGNSTEGWTIRTEGTTTALMAAVGMPRAAGFAEPNDLAEREASALEAVQLAVELGVDVNVANALGITALDAARDFGFYQSIVDYLVGNGAVPGERARSR